MLTRFLKRIKDGRAVVQVTNVASTLTGSTVKTSGNLYAVTLPGQEPVMLRATNQVEVKALVREAHGLKRLPVGTTVERVS